MELIQLRYFVAIAQAGSFTEAAKLLHVSQPALSYQMRRLEQKLGTRLFERKGKTIAITPDGEVFLPLAQEVLFRADEAVRVLQENLGIETGEVRMGCSPSVSTNVVPGLLAQFHRNYPRVRVELFERGDSELMKMVQKGDIDFAVVTASGTPRTLAATLLGTEDLFIVTSLKHRFAGREAVALGELAEENWVFPTDAYNLEMLVMDACRRTGFEPIVSYRAGTMEAVKNFVRQELGISVLPNISLRGYGRQDLAVMRVEGGLHRNLNLIRGKDRSMTRAAKALTVSVSTTIYRMMKQYPAAMPIAEMPVANLSAPGLLEVEASADDALDTPAPGAVAAAAKGKRG